MLIDEKYMARCLELAKNGIGTTRPNPSVGAVIVYEGKIIGEGYTTPYGGPHAEVIAVASVQDESLLQHATMYVTLEPCSHHGKTPPCADLIVRKQIPNVVIGTVDTNDLVAGEGIKRLKKAGCNVYVGVLEEECKKHHKRFFTVQNKQRPYVILKWAQTDRGFIAPKEKELQEPIWISNAYAKQLVHKWRSEEHAILVGTNTVTADNPKLTIRSWTGINPVRVILDRTLRLSTTLDVFDGTTKTIVITEEEKASTNEIFFEKIDFSKHIASQICNILHQHRIQSIIIEGGTQTLQTFIDENLWDEARVFSGSASFDNGIEAPILKAKVHSEEKIKNNTLRYFFND